VSFSLYLKDGAGYFALFVVGLVKMEKSYVMQLDLNSLGFFASLGGGK